MPEMTLRKFHNALRILLNIDMPEFAAAIYPKGVEDNQELFADWEKFRDDPYRWFIRAEDRKALAIWGIIEERNQ